MTTHEDGKQSESGCREGEVCDIPLPPQPEAIVTTLGIARPCDDLGCGCSGLIPVSLLGDVNVTVRILQGVVV